MVLEKTLESPLDCKEIHDLYPKQDSWALPTPGAGQSWFDNSVGVQTTAGEALGRSWVPGSFLFPLRLAALKCQAGPLHPVRNMRSLGAHHSTPLDPECTVMQGYKGMSMEMLGHE